MIKNIKLMNFTVSIIIFRLVEESNFSCLCNNNY